MGRANPSFHAQVLAKTVRTASGCWQWTGAKMGNGYGVVSIRRVSRPAHRYAYKRLIGRVPAELDMDHLCRNRACINPKHLEPVTRGENIRRSQRDAGPRTPRHSHCKHGHEWTPENTRTSKGQRYCRACDRLRWQPKQQKMVLP